MPRKINPRLKWRRGPRSPHGYREENNLAYWVKLSKGVSAHIYSEIVEGFGRQWVLTLWLYDDYRFALSTYKTLEQAKGGVCNHINEVTAVFIRAKQRADGITVRRP